MMPKPPITRTLRPRPARDGALARGLAAAVVLLAALPLLAAAPAAPPAAAEDVVARVNGRPILRRDFELAVQLQFGGRRRQAVGLEQLRATREQVLETLIDGELLYQKALKSHVEVSDADLQAEIQRLKKSFASPADFSRLLKESGVSEAEFREQARRSLVVSRFLESDVVGGLKLGEEDLKRYYDQNPAEMRRPEAVHVHQILVRVKPDAPLQARAEARTRIEAILKELRGGGDFASLARKFSEGPEASRGGDSGWMARGAGAPPVLERAAFALEPGQSSDILESRLGFHILKVSERRPEGPIPFEEAKARIRARLTARERQDRMKAYMTDLREGAKVERSLPAPPKARTGA